MIIAVLVAILLALVIIRMLVGQKVEIKTTYQYEASGGAPRASSPARSATEVAAILNAAPTDWIVYQGATPPLRLHFRGQSHEAFQALTKLRMDQLGRDNIARLPPADLQQFQFALIAEAYVVEWEGAQYPNGADMPYSPRALGRLMAQDPSLFE